MHYGPFVYFFAEVTPSIYALSLHDALPILDGEAIDLLYGDVLGAAIAAALGFELEGIPNAARSEEHTSELQSHVNLVCRLLLEKKKARSARCTWSSRAGRTTAPTASGSGM